MPTALTALPPLPPSLDAARRVIDTAVGRINIYESKPQDAAPGLPPLLLIHSINAAASAAEVRPLFEHYRHERLVVAIELPGYAFSERGDRMYTPRLMTDAIHAVLDLLAREHGPLAVDVLALSLSSEFAARAAMEAPHRIGRLALVSPTGLSRLKARRGAPGSTNYLPRLHAVLRSPRWSQGLFDALTRPAVIRYFLRKTWGSPHIDPQLWPYCVRTAREEGARFAPLCFLSMAMFSKDIHNVYESLQCPVWISMASRGDFTDYRGLALVQTAVPWQTHRVPGGALPYFEDLPDFVARLAPFWSAAPGPAAGA
jgi:pimeloyl-ACP methyl ester carboxylesterase